MKITNHTARLIMIGDVMALPNQVVEADIHIADFPMVVEMVKRGELTVSDDAPHLEKMTVAELKQYAAAHDISVDGLTKKDDLIDAIGKNI